MQTKKEKDYTGYSFHSNPSLKIPKLPRRSQPSDDERTRYVY